MTISATPSPRLTYTGSGTTGPFTTPPFQNASDLLVIKTTIADGTQVALALTADYTVTGAYDPVGGALTLVSAISSAYRLSIIIFPTTSQEVSYPENDKFPAKTHERALDKLTLILLWAGGMFYRCLRQPQGDAADIGYLPPKVTRASKILSFDANGDPETAITSADVAAAASAASAAVASAAAAAVSAAAALVSENNADASELATLNYKITTGNYVVDVANYAAAAAASAAAAFVSENNAAASAATAAGYITAWAAWVPVPAPNVGTIGSVTVTLARQKTIGKTQSWQVSIDFTVTAGAPTQIAIAYPSGAGLHSDSIQLAGLLVGGVPEVGYAKDAFGTSIIFNRFGGSAFAGACSIYGNFTWELV